MTEKRIWMTMMLSTVFVQPLITGCGDSSAAIRRRIAAELSGMSVASESDARMAVEHCRAAAHLMQLLDKQGRQMALGMWSGKLRQVRFDESSYGNRLASLNRYISFVDDVYALLGASDEDRDELWRFRLDAFQRINDELKKCEAEPKGGPYAAIPSIGSFMTQRNYREALRSRQFALIQSRFET